MILGRLEDGGCPELGLEGGGEGGTGCPGGVGAVLDDEEPAGAGMKVRDRHGPLGGGHLAARLDGVAAQVERAAGQFQFSGGDQLAAVEPGSNSPMNG